MCLCIIKHLNQNYRVEKQQRGHCLLRKGSYTSNNTTLKFHQIQVICSYLLTLVQWLIQLSKNHRRVKNQRETWTLDSYTERFCGLCHAMEVKFLEQFVPLEARVSKNQYKGVLSAHLYCMMKYFCTDGLNP